MKILLNHADSFEFEATKKALKNPEELSEGTRSGSAANALVVFVAVEKTDEGNEEKIVSNAIIEIKDVYRKVSAGTIVIYPYAHLSSSLSNLETADIVIKSIYSTLADQGFDVIRAPFGWYKAFNIKCKGHPLSELSREITASEKKTEASEALKAEEKLKSNWFVLTPEGELSEIQYTSGGISGFKLDKGSGLEKFARYELAKNRAIDKEPPHVSLMRKLELVDYEPGSDPGNLRYYPKGRLIKSLLEELVTQEVKDYGAMEIEAPIMYDIEHPSLKKYLNRFPARQYTIDTPNKKVFLRFAACFGQFLMAHDANISYKNLPLRLYELTKYSFRVEKRGELTGLRRLRSFTMPDCHAFVSDFEMAKEEMIRRFELSKRIQQKIGLDVEKDFEMGIRIVKDFYDENKDFVIDLVKKWGKPVLVEMWDKRFFYFVMKYEWNFIDALDKASALTTDQIDVENSKTYDITYIDSDGSEKNPIIMHLSPSGAIERDMYALLEKAYMQQQRGITPQLPLWLAPTQVRVLSVSQEQYSAAEKVADELTVNKIRADQDDRDLTLGKKIREAEKEWIPYIVVIGEKEAKEGSVTVRTRGEQEQKTMALKELIKEIKPMVEGLPYKTLPLPRELSKRPKFVG
jgi:threonyl-tRNA synthetase